MPADSIALGWPATPRRKGRRAPDGRRTPVVWGGETDGRRGSGQAEAALGSIGRAASWNAGGLNPRDSAATR